MKRLITSILFLSLILFISSASAVYPGDIATIDFFGQLDVIENWTVSGNTTNLNISNESLRFTFLVPTDYEPGQITITAKGYKDGYPTQSIGGGGGGSSKPKPIGKKFDCLPSSLHSGQVIYFPPAPMGHN